MKQKLQLTKTNDECGSSQPKLTVVLIHGIASDSSSYNEAMEYFRGESDLKNVRFITFDLLGSGLSLTDDSLNYDYDEQIEALNNAINDLALKTPLILVGHSLGTFIVTRFASRHLQDIERLLLVSPPVYTEDDLDNPIFALGMEAFKQTVSKRDSSIIETKAFNNSMENIVLSRDNYKVLSKLDTPTVLIYGDEDQIIASYNIPELLEKNSHLIGIETKGKHGVSRDKYTEIAKILKELLDA